MSDPREYRFIPVKNLRFDPENPRLPDDLHNADDEDILNWIIINGAIDSLMQSIISHGFSEAEPVLVVKSKTRQEEYLVVEGNRRLAAVMLINDPTGAKRRVRAIETVAAGQKEQIKSIPAVIYKDRNEILPYLGYRHISGIRPWKSLQKSAYLKQLFDWKLEESWKERDIFNYLQKFASVGPRVARKNLTVLEVYRQAEEAGYWGLDSLKPEEINYSILATAFNYKHIVQFLGLRSALDYKLNGLNTDSLRDLFKWCFVTGADNMTRLGESRNLKLLSAVVDNLEALETFRSDESYSLQDAARIAIKADEGFDILMRETRAILRIIVSMIADAEEIPQDWPNQIAELIDELQNIVDQIDSQSQDTA